MPPFFYWNKISQRSLNLHQLIHIGREILWKGRHSTELEAERRIKWDMVVDRRGGMGSINVLKSIAGRVRLEFQISDRSLNQEVSCYHHVFLLLWLCTGSVTCHSRCTFLCFQAQVSGYFSSRVSNVNGYREVGMVSCLSLNHCVMLKELLASWHAHFLYGYKYYEYKSISTPYQ